MRVLLAGRAGPDLWLGMGKSLLRDQTDPVRRDFAISPPIHGLLF